MKWWKILIIAVISILGFLSFLFYIFIGNPFLPVYEKLVIKQDSIPVDTIVTIDGVKYGFVPDIKWRVEPGNGRKIGYAGDLLTSVYEVENDPNRDFIQIDDFFADMNYLPMHRLDKDFPEPSADTIKLIDWMDSTEKGTFKRTIEDKKIIKDLFSAIDTGKKHSPIRPLKGTKQNGQILSMGIGCYSSVIPNATYNLAIGIYNGKIICSDYQDLYVEVPLKLLEEIAGKPLQIDDYQP